MRLTELVFLNKVAAFTLGHAAELAGLGILAKPSIDRLRGKEVDERKAAKYETAGLGVLALPSAAAIAHGAVKKMRGMRKVGVANPAALRGRAGVLSNQLARAATPHPPAPMGKPKLDVAAVLAAKKSQPYQGLGQNRPVAIGPQTAAGSIPPPLPVKRAAPTHLRMRTWTDTNPGNVVLRNPSASVKTAALGSYRPTPGSLRATAQDYAHRLATAATPHPPVRKLVNATPERASLLQHFTPKSNVVPKRQIELPAAPTGPMVITRGY